jgi:hypothetical protein
VSLVTRLRSVLLVALLVGCSTASPSTITSPTASPVHSSPLATSVPTPMDQPPASSTASFDLLPTEQPADFEGQIACTGPIGTSDPVAVVWLTVEDPAVEWPLVLRDYSDWTNPRTACTFVNVGVEQLIDAHHVVISSSDAKYAVVDLPEVKFHWFALPPWSEESYSTFIAVSPQMDQVAWLQERPSQDSEMSTTRELHITTATGDTVVASLTDQPTGFCGAPLDSSKRGAYSRSGEHLYFLDQGFSGAADYSLRVLEDLTTVLPVMPPSGGWPDGEHPAMAVWSPRSEALYYRQGETVWQWTPTEGVDSFLPGVSWSSPTITPDGKTLAYWLPGSDGTGEVYLADLEDGASSRLIGRARGAPVFLNDAQLWYRSATVDHGCIGVEGQPTVYNVLDGSEAPSVIESVRHVWPAVSSAY